MSMKITEDDDFMSLAIPSLSSLLQMRIYSEDSSSKEKIFFFRTSSPWKDFPRLLTRKRRQQQLLLITDLFQREAMN